MNTPGRRAGGGKEYRQDGFLATRNFLGKQREKHVDIGPRPMPFMKQAKAKADVIELTAQQNR